MRTIRYAILTGRIVGPIWEPGVIAWKDVSARIERSPDDFYAHGGPYPDLRTAMLALVRDGDFQSCGFVPGETFLHVSEEAISPQGTRTIRKRSRPIYFMCPDTSDMAASPSWLDEAYG